MLVPSLRATAAAWHAHAAATHASAVQAVLEPLLSARSPIAQSLLALPLAPPPTPLNLVQTALAVAQTALAVANLVLALVIYAVIHFTTSVTLFVAAQPPPPLERQLLPFALSWFALALPPCTYRGRTSSQSYRLR